MYHYTPPKKLKSSWFRQLKSQITEIFMVLVQLVIIALLACIPFAMLYLFVKVIRIAWGP